MVRHLRGAFERAAVLEISGNAGRAERVVANARNNVGGFGAPLDHRVGVRLGQWTAGELAGRAPGKGKTRNANGASKRVSLIGSRSADFIKASGHTKTSRSQAAHMTAHDPFIASPKFPCIAGAVPTYARNDGLGMGSHGLLFAPVSTLLVLWDQGKMD
jgi:hypothetical protein